MNQQSIKTFLTAAELGSFSRAGQQLGLSRQLVSNHIAGLEKELGAKLFSRTTASVSLTAAGHIYREVFLELERDHDELMDSIAALRRPPSPQIRLGILFEFHPDELNTRLEHFCREFPQYEVILTRCEPEAMPAMLDSGELDLIFTFHSDLLRARNHQRLCLRPFVTEQICLFAHSSLFRAEDPESLSRLLRLPCYLWKRDGQPEDATIRAFSDHMARLGFPLFDIRTVPNPISVRTMVEMGKGITVMSSSSPLARNRMLHQIPLTPPDSGTAVVCAWRRDDPRPHIRTFADIMCPELQEVT